MVLPAAEGVGNAVDFMGSNPLTVGGAVGGGFMGGVPGALVGGTIGGALDTSGRPPADPTGIADPGLFQPYQSSPGLQPGDTTGLEGITDFTKPGSGEVAAGKVSEWSPVNTTAAWNYSKPYFTSPTRSETYSDVVTGQAPAMRSTTDYAGQAYRGLNRKMTTAADLGPYFERAKQRAARDINRQAAARGSFGASRTQDQLSEAFADLEAKRALEEAGYGLERSADERAWAGLRGELAGAADLSNRAGIGTEMGWMTGMGNLAGMGDVAERDKVRDYLGAAFDLDRQSADKLMRDLEAGIIGQNLGQGRSLDLFASATGLGNRMSDILGQGYGNEIMMDKDTMDRALEFATGTAAIGRQQSAADQEALMRDAVTMFNVGKDLGWWGV